MKRNLRKHLKLCILSLVITLTFFSCQKDDIQNHIIEQHSNLPLKMDIVTSKQIQENEMLSLQLKKYQTNKEDFLNREIYNPEYDFTVDTDYAKYMESQDGNFHSYTFTIIQDSTDLVLKNLVLSSYNNSDYQAILVKYQLNESQFQELKLNDHISSGFEVEVENLEGDFSNLLARDGEDCDFEVTVYHLTPDTGETFEFGEGSTCQHINPVTGETECEVHMVIVIDCPNTGGSSSGNSSGTSTTDGSDGSDWTWGYGTGGSSTANNENNGVGNNNPVGTSPLINKKEMIRRQKLLEISNNQIVKDKIDELFPKVFSDEYNNYKEDGARFKLIGENQYEVREPNLRLNNGVEYEPDYLDKETVSIHIHQQKFYDASVSLDPFLNSQVFSDEDIIEFLENVDFIESTDPELTDDVTSILISEIGAFALVVEDKELAGDALNALQDPNIKERFINDFQKKVLEDWINNECDNAYLVSNLKDFINKYKINGQKLGVEIYQAIIINNQITSWYKL